MLAENITNIDSTGGALGAGVGLGVGAALDLISIRNRTVALIRTGSKIYTIGDVTVKAVSERNIDSKVYSVGGGLFGLSGAVSIIIIGTSMDKRPRRNLALLYCSS